MKEAIMLGKAQAEDQSISKCARVNVVWCVCSSLVKVVGLNQLWGKNKPKDVRVIDDWRGKENQTI